MANWSFAYPYVLLLLLVIPLLHLYRKRNEKRLYMKMRVSEIPENVSFFSIKSLLLPIANGLRFGTIALLIIAVARPQTSDTFKKTITEGIDIVLSSDISPSMLYDDFRPNRLEVAKKVAQEFVMGRQNDRIGLVVFSKESFTQCPLTTDHRILQTLLESVQSGVVEYGTAIGLGLATAVNRLVESKAKSKVIILMTDGVNNSGSTDPLTAMELAKAKDIRVYTIGIGSVKNQTGFEIEEIDEVLLKQIAEETEGKYFRANNANKLRQIYAEIDQMEKTKIKGQNASKKEDHYFFWVGMSLLFLLIELFIRNLYLRTTI